MVVPEVVELLLGQLCENTIIQTLYCGRPRTIINQANLPKVVAGLYLTLLIIFAHIIAHRHFALPAGNETQELVVRVILLAEDVLRQLEARCDLVYKELHDFSLVLEERVLADSCLENVLRDRASQTRRYDHQKLIQLLLVIQIALCPRHEITYLLLDALLQQHVPHGRVREIELLLETLTLPIKLLHHHGQVTKHVGLHQGAHEQIQ